MAENINLVAALKSILDSILLKETRRRLSETYYQERIRLC